MMLDTVPAGAYFRRKIGPGPTHGLAVVDKAGNIYTSRHRAVSSSSPDGKVVRTCGPQYSAIHDMKIHG